MKPDFSGYATKYGLKCSDGRTIMQGAFKSQDGQRIPLVWQHNDSSVTNVLGHVDLEHRDDGVYAYGFLNDTPPGNHAKALIKDESLKSLSIRAKKLVERGGDVLHGRLHEVSLVMAGANPEATIDNVYLEHSDGSVYEIPDEAIIYTGLELKHEEDDKKESEKMPDKENSGGGETVKDVYESLNEKQKNVLHYLVGKAVEEKEAEHGYQDDDDDQDLTHYQEDPSMRRNIFDQSDDSDYESGYELTHAQTEQIFADAQKIGSLKESVLLHAEQYGITNIDDLFPRSKDVNTPPEWITRDMEWVDGVINGARSLPFSRIRSRSADLTHEEARAKGYIKSSLKKEQFFSISQRETHPKTIYKKQKLDRDDIVDITDFDVVAWMKAEMRFMLKEEIARAILIGDGRDPSDPDKINENNIRPIAKDDNFYAHKVAVPVSIAPKNLINQILRARKHYKGSGSPTFYTTEDVITDLLLAEDKIGRRYYESVDALARAIRVDKIVAVEVMESEPTLLGIMVNMRDYSVGSTKGGETTMFDDFDIDYNQHKYLIETRMSGALTKHKTALVFERADGLTEAIPDAPTFDGTDTIVVPDTPGIIYTDGDNVVTDTTIVLDETTNQVTIHAEPDDGYYIPLNLTVDWTFNFVSGD